MYGLPRRAEQAATALLTFQGGRAGRRQPQPGQQERGARPGRRAAAMKCAKVSENIAGPTSEERLARKSLRPEAGLLGRSYQPAHQAEGAAGPDRPR